MVKHNGVLYRAADAHAHIYPGKIAEKATENVGRFYDLPMAEVGLPHVLNEEGTAVGSINFSSAPLRQKWSQVGSINRFIAAKCEKYPKFVGLGAWHRDIEDVEKELNEIQALGRTASSCTRIFKGFAIDDEKMLPVYKACMARDLPILFHMGDARSELSAPKKLANVLEKLPELKCIAAHLGGYQRWDEAKACLKGANVWVDTSSSLFVLNPDEARRSIEHFGMDKVMFGTDFPMWTHKKELERFFALGYGEDENRKMLYDNFEKLFKL